MPTNADEKWFAVQPERCQGWWIVSTHPDGASGHDIDSSGDGGFTEERARLIAAAPEMLKALKHAHDALLLLDIPNSNAFKLVEAAIAKAENEG